MTLLPVIMEPFEEKTVLLCALDDDVDGLKRILESKNGTDSQQPESLLWEKDELGRNALFAACTLGRSGIVRELVRNCADVNELTARGYSPLHCSAMWGQLDTLKTLVELNADFQAINFCGEKPVDVARRYHKLDCAEYLAWAEAKQSLQAFIQEVRGTVDDQEKVQGKLNKEDKNMCLNSCSTKSDWIHNTKDATIQDFIEQKKHLEDVLAPVLHKLNTQSEAPTKTRKH